MKRTYTILLIIGLMLINAQISLGAVHNADGDFPYYGYGTGTIIDNLTPPGKPWFSIAGDTHYLDIRAAQKNDDSLGLSTLYSVEEFQNDQMFGTLNYLTPANTYSYLGSFRCGYLFDDGLDLGVDYYLSADKAKNLQNSALLSVGYRYNFKKAGYAAVSADYLYGQTVKGIYGYDLDFKYFLNKIKINGQVYQPTALRNDFHDTLLNLQLNYQLFDFLVCGGTLNYQPVNGNNTLLYEAGLTITKPNFTINGKAGKDSDGINFYKANGSLEISSSYRLGVEYSQKQTDTPRFTYTVSSDENDLHLFLGFTPGVNGGSPNWSVKYKLDPFNENIVE